VRKELTTISSMTGANRKDATLAIDQRLQIRSHGLQRRLSAELSKFQLLRAYLVRGLELVEVFILGTRPTAS
jgi:hypothetical protein